MKSNPKKEEDYRKILRGSAAKEFAIYHLSERSFVYLLYAFREEVGNPRKVLDSEDWRTKFSND